MLFALNRSARTIAGHPSSQKRVVVLRLLASQEARRELRRLSGMGLYKISLTGYGTVLAVVERATMRCTVQLFRLASRLVSLHESLASQNGASGKTRVERLGFCGRAAQGGQ